MIGPPAVSSLTADPVALATIGGLWPALTYRTDVSVD